VICKSFDLRIKRRRLENADHGASVNHSLHAVNRGYVFIAHGPQESGDLMAAEKQQFQLPLTVTTCRVRKLETPHNGTRARTSSDRLVGIDRVLRTHDVERITGKHRCTIWRWMRAGTFPPKRAGGGCGWLRSDVERWLQGNERGDRL
jgi:prophage regulatory protein